jgi:hypothetical protein
MSDENATGLTVFQQAMGLKEVDVNAVERELSALGLSGSAFLGELRLVGFSGELVTDHNQRAGDFCYKRDKSVTALGKETDFIPLTYRVKAIDFNSLAVSFTPESSVFRDIHNRSAQANSNCATGPEFLVYIPTIGKFATYHLGSKSAQKGAMDLVKRLMKPVHAKSTLAENAKKQKWFVPNFSDSAVAFDAPEQEDAQEALRLYESAKARETQAPPEANTSGNGREV